MNWWDIGIGFVIGFNVCWFMVWLVVEFDCFT